MVSSNKKSKARQLLSTEDMAEQLQVETGNREAGNSLLHLLSGRWQNRELDVVVIDDTHDDGDAQVWYLGDTDPFGTVTVTKNESDANTFEVQIAYNEDEQEASVGILKGSTAAMVFPNQIQWLDGDFWMKIDYGESDETSSETRNPEAIQILDDDVCSARRWTKNGQLGSDRSLATTGTDPPRMSDLPTEKTRRHLLLSNEAVEDMPMSPLCRSPAGKSGISFPELAQ